jgi:hypothetical protein
MNFLFPVNSMHHMFTDEGADVDLEIPKSCVLPPYDQNPSSGLSIHFDLCNPAGTPLN